MIEIKENSNNGVYVDVHINTKPEKINHAGVTITVMKETLRELIRATKEGELDKYA